MVMKRTGKCRGCGGVLTAGETVVRLRLKKTFQAPCNGCGHKPAKLKVFHTHCVPSDINRAMGVDPTRAPQAPGGAVPPPAKPQTPEDAALVALSALEHALKVRAARRGVTPELEKAFKTFQGIKARVLRPGTPAEGETAECIAIKRIVDLVYKS